MNDGKDKRVEGLAEHKNDSDMFVNKSRRIALLSD